MKVAILQNSISKGGRFSVIARLIKNLNERGIIPDLLTGKIDFPISEVETWYGYPIQVNVLDSKNYNKHFSEYHILTFNRQISSRLDTYDLVINSSNTSLFLKHDNLLEYLHFPRYKRIIDGESFSSKTGIQRALKLVENKIVKQIYNIADYPKCNIYANSEFTANSFRELYPDVDIKGIWYPPISVPESIPTTKKSKKVINLGRFHPSKKQFEIIKLAEQLRNFTFYIVGFVEDNNPYFKKCEKYLTENRVKNVFLFPNASIKKRDQLLKESSYFLHLLVNEPFGISTVQGIANGCLPIVPDSGGQKEIVINKDLRFQSFYEIPDILKNTAEWSEATFKNNYLSLFKHIQKFSLEEFDKKFHQIIK